MKDAVSFLSIVLFLALFFCLPEGKLWAQEDEEEVEKEYEDEERYGLDLFIEFYPLSVGFLYDKDGFEIPLHLHVGIGWDWLYNAPSEMDLRFWPSNVWEVAMGTEFPVSKLKSVVVPMLGLSGQHYRFENDITLDRDSDASRVVPADQFVTNAQELNLDRSSYNLTYLDFATEIRLYPFGNFRYRHGGIPFFALGGFAGYLLNSRTRLKYTADGAEVRAEYKKDYHTPPFQYGVCGKIGFGFLTFFYRHQLSRLFREGRGPFQTQARSGSAGIEVGF